MYLGKIETGQSYKKIIFVFGLLTIFIIGFVIYASFSKATITLNPKKEKMSINFKAQIAKNITLDIQGLESIQGRIISTSLEENQKITEISEKEINEKAKGKVVIYNKRSESQPLLPNTQILSSEGVLFRTDQKVVVPAGGEIEVSVTADQEGPSGNIGPSHFTIVKIWKDWQSLIYAESKEAMTGGTKIVKFVTQEEIDKAKDKMAEELYAKAIDKLKLTLSSGEKFSEKTIQKEILEVKTSVKPETPAEEYNMNVKVSVTAVVFDEEKLLSLALAKLKDKISNDKEFINYDPESFKYNMDSLDLKNNTAILNVNLEGETVAKLSSQVFDKEKLIGRDEYEVKKYFEGFEDIAFVEVKFSPFWVRSVPSLKEHIEIMVNK